MFIGEKNRRDIGKDKNLSRIDFQMSSPGPNILNTERDNKKACRTSRKWFIKFMFMVCEASRRLTKSLDHINLFSNSTASPFLSTPAPESFKEIDYFPHDRALLIIPDFLADGWTAWESKVASINGALKWSIIMLHFNVLLILLSGASLGSPSDSCLCILVIS